MCQYSQECILICFIILGRFTLFFLKKQEPLKALRKAYTDACKEKSNQKDFCKIAVIKQFQQIFLHQLNWKQVEKKQNGNQRYVC